MNIKTIYVGEYEVVMLKNKKTNDKNSKTTW